MQKKKRKITKMFRIMKIIMKRLIIFIAIKIWDHKELIETNATLQIGQTTTDKNKAKIENILKMKIISWILSIK
jgi:hypothetical protein